mmetsp:Transcript_26698/g.67252  ORF Transcript_26698/g.67252 Transcript_26698/m.67252 type:complete len:242 (+) Transcript_26698:499-1224(+)
MKMRTASVGGNPGSVTSKMSTRLTCPYLEHSSATSSSSVSSTSPGPTMLRSSTIVVGVPWKDTPLAFLGVGCCGGPGGGAEGCALMMTPAWVSVFCATSGVIIPCLVRPSPCPSFHPILAIMRAAALMPPPPPGEGVGPEAEAPRPSPEARGAGGGMAAPPPSPLPLPGRDRRPRRRNASSPLTLSAVSRDSAGGRAALALDATSRCSCACRSSASRSFACFSASASACSRSRSRSARTCW